MSPGDLVEHEQHGVGVIQHVVFGEVVVRFDGAPREHRHTRVSTRSLELLGTWNGNYDYGGRP